MTLGLSLAMIPTTLQFFNPEPRQVLYFDSIASAIAYFGLVCHAWHAMNDVRIFSPASK